MMQQGNFKEATKRFSEALRIKPDNAKAHYHLGIALAQQGRLKEALNHYYETLRIKPDFSFVVHYNIACMYARQNKVEESIGWLKKAIKRGFKDWNLLKTDRDLEKVKGSTHYKELIKKYGG